MDKLIVKAHTAKEGIIVAVCDPDILGKKFETDRLQLDLTSSFYKGELMSEEALDALVRKAYILYTDDQAVSWQADSFP